MLRLIQGFHGQKKHFLHFTLISRENQVPKTMSTIWIESLSRDVNALSQCYRYCDLSGFRIAYRTSSSAVVRVHAHALGVKVAKDDLTGIVSDYFHAGNHVEHVRLDINFWSLTPTKQRSWGSNSGLWCSANNCLNFICRSIMRRGRNNIVKISRKVFYFW